jgi:tRNA A-37 threonylcarbamoyl transferase component Bud32
VIQVGQVLDKYELLERVGQGGMAVVYRGIDRTLKRVVAVKVLHKHLSDYQEARDRFEREAQAVAKLRHENILEIFDYSGSDDAEALGSSYIVTEFIEGGTLKQVITERPIGFPEVGAMVVLQVCRALAHAHAAGILHRDVKPENIMIRTDGVVKLMDFGISHMVDLERLTVTGQLLGSPAYMAPEHVEGRPIDFRTDVFAAGIVLYQLTVGKLPFEGKNPHEVLKRIAECKFVDPRQANPRIGNRLGKIILRAMAADPADRFPGIGEMVAALEGYLDESGIQPDKVPGELSRYFAAPPSYEAALEERLIDTLTRKGQELLAAQERAPALDIFDRVLTIDADNAKVLAILDGINRRTRLKAYGMAAATVLVIGAGAYTIHKRSLPPDNTVPQELGNGTVSFNDRNTVTVQEPPAPYAIDAGPIAILDDARGAVRPPVEIDAAPAPAGIATTFRVFPAKEAQYRVAGSSAWLDVPDGGLVSLSIAAETTIEVHNRGGCCADDSKLLRPGEKDVIITTTFYPATIEFDCPYTNASASVEGTSVQIRNPFTVSFENATGRTKGVSVQFLGQECPVVDDKCKPIDSRPQLVEVVSGKKSVVKCATR